MTPTDADKARVLARFRSMRGRGGVRVSFVTVGAFVVARDPDELRRATADVSGSPTARSARARAGDDGPVG